MKNFSGYSKLNSSNSEVLLGGGGTKALSDFSGTISWDATNNQLKVTNVAGTSSNITIAQATSATKLGTATVGSTSLPIYLNSGTATAVTASSLFSSLTNSGNNISITIAGLNRTLTPAYASVAGYLSLNYMSTPTTSDYTVLDAKNELATLVSSQPRGVGKTIYVDASVIRLWSNEDATLSYSSAYAMIKIGGAYSGSTYGLWLLSSHNTTSIGVVGRYDNIWSSVKWLAYTSDNVASASKLYTARTINGTSFDGSANITTANWGTSRSIYIADSDGTNTGSAVSVNGSANATLKLPATIKATLNGTASKSDWLNTNTSLTYGASGLNYFNIKGTAGTTANENVTPTSNWYHILRMNHADSRGYFVDIAAGLDNANGMYWRRVSVGTNYGWYKILDSNNYTTYCATASHTHSYAGSSSAGGAANSVANSLTLSYGGTSSWTYNGSAAKTINIKAGSNVTVSGDSSGNITISSTDTNTHYSSKNIVNSATTSTANTSTALTNGNVYLNHIENGSVTSYHKISGSGASTVTTDASGNIIISSTNTTYTSLKNPNSLTLSYYPNTASSASTSWAYDGSAAKTLNLKYGTYINVSGDTSGNISFSHTTSGVTAGSYGATSNATLSHSGTFKVPYYTVDSYGHLTAAGAITYTLPSDNNTTYSTATYSYLGLIKPWYSHTAASTGPTTGSDSTAVAVNTITSTSGKYYAIEMDSNGRAFVNVPWSNTTYTFTANNPTLDWSTTSTLGTIGGTTFKVTMPANPNTDTKVTSVANHYSPSANSSYALGATSAATLSFGGSVITGLTRDAKGHLTGVVTGTLPSNPNTDYKASSYNTTSKIFLIGATSLTTSTSTGTTTYSNSGCYASGGYLYSGSAKVLTSHQTIYKLTLSSGTFSATSYTPNSAAVTVNIPTSTSHLTFNTIATYNGLGGIKPAYSTTGAVTLTTTSATNTTTPTIATRTTTSGRFYAVEVDVNGVPYVNVPWSNTNTTTTAASSDSTSKLYLIGATSQSSSGVTTYSNSSCYATNGSLYTSDIRTDSLYSKTSGKQLLTCNDASTIALQYTNDSTGYFTLITRNGVSRSWRLGREGAIIRQTSINGWSPAISIKTTNGSWEIGAYNDSSFLDYLTFCYVPDTSYNAASTSTTAYTYRFSIDSTGALVGDKVGKYLKLYVDGGSTENTNMWSFNGAYLKQINFVSGTNISLVGSSNAITVNTTSTITATAFYTSSDIKLKENIKPLSEHIREFNWKESGKKSYGIIAQELEKEYPELVIEKDDVKRVDYTAALCLLVAKLENRIKELENVIRNSN